MLSTRLPLLTILEYPAPIVVDNARSPYYSASSSSFKKDGDLPRLCFYKETMKKSKSQRKGTSSSSFADDRAPCCRRRGSRRCSSFPSPENEKNSIMMNRWESSMSHPTAASGTPKGGGDKAPIRRCRSFDDSSSDLRSKQQNAEGLNNPLDCCLSEAFDSHTLDSEPRQPTRRNSFGSSSNSSLDDILQDALDVIDSVEF